MVCTSMLPLKFSMWANFFFAAAHFLKGCLSHPARPSSTVEPRFPRPTWECTNVCSAHKGCTSARSHASSSCAGSKRATSDAIRLTNWVRSLLDQCIVNLTPLANLWHSHDGLCKGCYTFPRRGNWYRTLLQQDSQYGPCLHYRQCPFWQTVLLWNTNLNPMMHYALVDNYTTRYWRTRNPSKPTRVKCLLVCIGPHDLEVSCVGLVHFRGESYTPQKNKASSWTRIHSKQTATDASNVYPT